MLRSSLEGINDWQVSVSTIASSTSYYSSDSSLTWHPTRPRRGRSCGKRAHERIGGGRPADTNRLWLLLGLVAENKFVSMSAFEGDEDM